jgi:hypothetical protein
VLVCLLVAACSGSNDRPATATNPPAAAVGRQRVNPELARQLQTHFGASPDAFRNRRAFLVSVDGELAVEHYHHSAPDMHLNVQDVGRSIMSTLIGSRWTRDGCAASTRPWPSCSPPSATTWREASRRSRCASCSP